MDKNNREKTFLLSILFVGLLVGCGTKDNTKSIEDSEVKIKEFSVSSNELELWKLLANPDTPLKLDSTIIGQFDTSQELQLINNEYNIQEIINPNTVVDVKEQTNYAKNILTWLRNPDNIFSLLNLIILTILGIFLIYYLRQISKAISLNNNQKYTLDEGVNQNHQSNSQSRSKFIELEVFKILNQLRTILDELAGKNKEVSNENNYRLTEAIKNSLSNFSKEINYTLEKSLKGSESQSRINKNEIDEGAKDLKKQQPVNNDQPDLQRTIADISGSASTPNIKYTSVDLETLENLVANYNTRNIQNQKVYKVATTRESIEEIRTGVKASLILKQDQNDSYWVLSEPRSPDDNYYLVPKFGFVISDRIYQTVEDIFICQGYQNRSSNTFKLIRPAIVEFLKNKEWKLLYPGELKFDEN